MKKFLLVLMLGLIVAYACSPSVGRKVLKRGELDLEVSLGGAFFKYTPIALPLPNVGISVRYGVMDNLNFGVRVFPLYLVFNTFQIAPYGVLKVYESDNVWVPSINVYSEINSLIYVSPIQGVFYPLVGFSSVWRCVWGNVYIPLELSFDSYNDRRPLKFNLGVGVDVSVFERFNLTVEFRINSIGNIYLPLGNAIGVPVLFVSTSYRF